MKCLGSVSVRSMHSLRSVEEHMRNVNEKKNFKRVGNVTDVFWALYGAFGESPWSMYEY